MIDILLVEDDKEICFILTELLKRNHYNVSAYHNGIEAIEALSSKKYDLMLLDLMLPDLPGEKILFHLKKHNNSIPVIVISAKNQPEIRINLLRSGADDYITKPFSVRELMARVKANLRKAEIQVQSTDAIEEPKKESILIEVGELSINIEKFEVKVRGKVIDLTLWEFEVLKYLANQPGQVVTRETLLEKVWGYEYYGDIRTVDVTVRRIREKIEKDTSAPKILITKRGVGYYLATN